MSSRNEGKKTTNASKWKGKNESSKSEEKFKEIGMNHSDMEEKNVEILCENVKKLGGILLRDESLKENNCKTSGKLTKGASRSNTTAILNKKYSSSCWIVYNLIRALRNQLEQLNEDPSKESIRAFLEINRVVKTVAAKKEANYLFRQIGLMNELHKVISKIESYNPEHQSGDGDEKKEEEKVECYHPVLSHLMNDTATAIDCLKKTSEDAFYTFGYGFDLDSGNFEQMIQIAQNNYGNVGMAWTIWDAAIVLSQWIYDNRDLFVGKKVLEMGSGCGLCGIIAAMYADQVVLSDYTADIDKFIKENIKLNEKVTKVPPLSVIIDWTTETLLQEPSFLKKGVDIIIGADIFFHPQLSPLLAKSVHSYLGPKGIFYGSSSSFRIGIIPFVEEMKNLGYKVEGKLPGVNDNIMADNDKMAFFYCYK